MTALVMLALVSMTAGAVRRPHPGHVPAPGSQRRRAGRRQDGPLLTLGPGRAAAPGENGLTALSLCLYCCGTDRFDKNGGGNCHTFAACRSGGQYRPSACPHNSYTSFTGPMQCWWPACRRAWVRSSACASAAFLTAWTPSTRRCSASPAQRRTSWTRSTACSWRRARAQIERRGRTGKRQADTSMCSVAAWPCCRMTKEL